MAAKLRANGKISRQLILLAALYARTDQATLLKVRKMLQPWTFLADAVPSQLSAPSALFVVGGIAVGAVLVTGAANASKHASANADARNGGGASSARVQGAWTAVSEKPIAWSSGIAGVCAVGVGLYLRQRHARSLRRAIKLQSNVRVVKKRPVNDVADVLDLFVKGNDDVEMIRCAQNFLLGPICTHCDHLCLFTLHCSLAVLGASTLS